MRKVFLITRFVISACVILFVIALIIGLSGLNDAFSGASYKPIEEEYAIDSINGGQDKVVMNNEVNETIADEEIKTETVTKNVIDTEHKTTNKQEKTSNSQGKENSQHIVVEKEKDKNDKTTISVDKQKDNNSNSTTIVENEKNTIQNLPKEEEVIEENKEDKTENKIEENKEEEVVKEEDNSINTSHLDYPIHKGRIDCTDYSVCMNETLDFYFKYKKSVSNVFYVEVKSNSGKTLGYFNEYVFKEGTYSDYDECQRKGNEIKSILSDRVTGYQCDSSNKLKINTDY